MLTTQPLTDGHSYGYESFLACPECEARVDSLRDDEEMGLAVCGSCSQRRIALWEAEQIAREAPDCDAQETAYAVLWPDAIWETRPSELQELTAPTCAYCEMRKTHVLDERMMSGRDETCCEGEAA